jgi:hypothetical protein
MTRCQCEVYDITEDTYRHCKNSAKFTIYLNKQVNYCQIHASKYYQGYCIIIQKHYKSYRTRRKIESLFINLPLDLQRKILFHIREPLYLQRVYNKISGVINPKIETFIENIDYESIMFEKEASIYFYLSREEIDSLCYLLSLIFKYRIILSRNLLKEMYTIVNTLHINYIISDVENTVYKNEWSPLIRHFNQLKTLKRI